MPPTRALHADFREAYCHRHGCGAGASFERHLLLRIIPWPFRPLAALSFWIDPTLFAAELEVIRNAARARTGREVNEAAQDLVHLRFVELSFRRSIGMRGRSEAVVAAWNAVKETVDRPTQPDHPSVGFRQSATTLKAAPRSAALRRKDSGAAFRLLQHLQDGVARGKPIGRVLDAAGLDAGEVLGLLDSHPEDGNRFAELRRHLVRHLEARSGALSEPQADPGSLS